MTVATTIAQLPKSYVPAEAEPDVRARWEGSDAFHVRPDDPGEPFCIVIPPPNVTAALHLGHALNNTLQDVLVRYHRMRGFKSLWMPGTDHAGIATQSVVEKRLLLQGKKRTDFTREEFIAKVQEWKDEYEATILEQLKAMGCSCDWARTRFTMDEVCAKAVREAFFRLFKDGLIYRGKRLVNWDPVTLTALADDEVEMKEVQGHMWYLRYPLEDGSDHVTVATTRPETMLGDTAVAINPKDPRAETYVGKNVKLPIVDRIIPIIADEYVVMPGTDDPKAEFATGFLKVTPAHDTNDYEIGQRHELPIVNVLAPDASISDKHGWEDVSDEARPLIGLSREAARKMVVDWFKQHELLENIRDYTHSVGHSYRSHVPIEPYLSDQWYVKVTDDRMRGEALRAMNKEQIDRSADGAHAPESDDKQGDGELQFFPARYAKTFQSWHENLRDWCISRQLWWGHRIPVWSLTLFSSGSADPHESLRKYAKDSRIDGDNPNNPEDWPFSECASQCFVDERTHRHVWYICPPVGRNDIEDALRRFNLEQDLDVLDTWFSSALWPISTMGWPEPGAIDEIENNLLDTFNPSTVLVTAREIITLWVSRMVMFNRHFRDGKLPFRDVYIHPMIQDGYGQRMSKSLGNGVDPRDIIHSHGTDALRFTLTQLATSTQDVRLPIDMICPHCDTTVHPNEITSPAGYRVADAEQQCPKCKGKMISAYGAASGLAMPTDNIPLARNTSAKFDLGRNFANKLWNATRFAIGNLETSRHQGIEASSDSLSLVDRWIITRLHRTLHTVEDALKDYQFNVYADAMYDFVWRDFCDWYLEAIKPTVKDSPAQQQILRTVLNAIMRLLHPIMPFVTEALWPHVQATGEAGIEGIQLPPHEILAKAPWPNIKCSVDDKEAAAAFERIQALTNGIRTIRAERQVQPRKKIQLSASPEILSLIESAEGVVQALTGIDDVAPTRSDDDDALPMTFEGREILLHCVVEKVDRESEKARLSKIIEEKERAIHGFQQRLSNENYVKKAPPEKVSETREMLTQAEADLAAATKALQSLDVSRT